MIRHLYFWASFDFLIQDQLGLQTTTVNQMLNLSRSKTVQFCFMLLMILILAMKFASNMVKIILAMETRNVYALLVKSKYNLNPRHQVGGFMVVPEDLHNNRKTKKTHFNYYHNPFNIKEKAPTPDPEEDYCFVCQTKLEMDVVNHFIIPAGHFKTIQDQEVCARCFRHYKLFNMTWPQRSISAAREVVRDLDYDDDDVDDEADAEFIKAGSDVPGEPAPNPELPYIVWVYPAGSDSSDLWWPAMIIPRDYCENEKSLSKLAADASDSDIVVLFFEGPSM